MHSRQKGPARDRMREPTERLPRLRADDVKGIRYDC